MTADDFREIALSMQDAVERAHMGHPDFRANGRIFASLHANERSGTVKLTEEEQRELVRAHPKVFAPAAGAWGRQGWTTIDLKRADARTARAAILLAWQNVVHAPPRRSATRTAPAAKALRKRRGNEVLMGATSRKSVLSKSRHASDVSMPAQSVEDQVAHALESLERMGSAHDRDNLKRFGITASKAFGVSMANIQRLAKQFGRRHELAAELWATGWYEARLLAAFVDEPARVTPGQMDRWCRDFDNWGICDTVCFHLFDRTPHAWDKVNAWHDARGEFVKRAAFALLASLGVHDKTTGDGPFVESLGLVESAATDDRNFVKKGVSWALRVIGRRNSALNTEALAVARRLSGSPSAAARWVGKDAVKELTSPLVKRQLSARRPGRQLVRDQSERDRQGGSREVEK